MHGRAVIAPSVSSIQAGCIQKFFQGGEIWGTYKRGGGGGGGWSLYEVLHPTLAGGGAE